MKISEKFCLIGVGLIAAVGLSSCVTYESVSYNTSPARTSVSTSSSFSLGSTQSWGNSYGDCHDSFGTPYRGGEQPCHDTRPCPHCGSKHGCKHQQHGNHHKDEKKPPSKKLKHHPKSYQIVGGSTGSKVRPKGFHSISWYKSKGYDVNKLKLRNEKGEYYRR